MAYLKALFSGWVNRMHVILTIAAIVFYLVSDVGHKDVHIPAWITLLVGGGAFVSVSYRIWNKERLRADANQSLRDSITLRRNATILDWIKLKELHGSQALPDPMSPTWGSGECTRPYNIGVLQSRTNCLWNMDGLYKVRSIDELVEKLKQQD